MATEPEDLFFIKWLQKGQVIRRAGWGIPCCPLHLAGQFCLGEQRKGCIGQVESFQGINTRTAWAPEPLELINKRPAVCKSLGPGSCATHFQVVQMQHVRLQRCGCWKPSVVMPWLPWHTVSVSAAVWFLEILHSMWPVPKPSTGHWYQRMYGSWNITYHLPAIVSRLHGTQKSFVLRKKKEMVYVHISKQAWWG